MSEKPYDKKTEEKLYKLYKNVISNYSLENNKKDSQIQDLKATLKLNKNLLYEFLNSSDTNKEEINNLINKSENLWDKIEKLIEDKKKTQINIYKLQVLLKNASDNINQELNDIVGKTNLFKTEINQKDKLIKKLKQDLEKIRKTALFPEARTEVYICEPSKKNIDKNEEFRNARYILGKMMAKHNKLRSEAISLKNQKDDLKSELTEMKIKVPEEYFINNTIKNMGYNNSIEEEEEKDEINSESEEEEKSDSSQEGSPENKKLNKQKEKEAEKLTNKYNELKEVYASFQNKINEYKVIYKKYKDNK